MVSATQTIIPSVSQLQELVDLYKISPFPTVSQMETLGRLNGMTGVDVAQWMKKLQKLGPKAMWAELNPKEKEIEKTNNGGIEEKSKEDQQAAIIAQQASEIRKFTMEYIESFSGFVNVVRAGRKRENELEAEHVEMKKKIQEKDGKLEDSKEKLKNAEKRIKKLEKKLIGQKEKNDEDGSEWEVVDDEK